MKKIILSIFILMVIFIAACQQPVKKQAMEKNETAMEKEPATTGDAAVDAVGKDLNNVDTVEKDLSADQLNDVESGLEDIQNI